MEPTKPSTKRPGDEETTTHRQKRLTTDEEKNTKSADTKAHIVTKSSVMNTTDPFQVLSPECVALVISFLPSTDTEVLRRVSQTWKASSEASCGRKLLQDHFPWALAQGLDRYQTPEQSNLQFRRCLYFEESLKIGLATKTFSFTDAFDWCINGTSLIWGSKYGTISIQDLRTRTGYSDSPPPLEQLELGQIIATFRRLRYLLLTNEGDIIVVWIGVDDRLSSNRARLTKISRQRAIMWEVFVSRQMVKPAIGKDVLYYLQYEPNDGGHANFIARSLRDGSALYTSSRDIEWFDNLFPSMGLPCVRLTSSGRWAVWNSICNMFSIYSTSSGEIVHSFSRRGVHKLIMSATNDAFWAVSLPSKYETSSILFTYNEDTKSFVEERLTLQPEDRPRQDTFGLDFSVDHETFFRLIIRGDDEMSSSRYNSSGRIAGLAIGSAVQSALSVLSEPVSLNLVTLPAEPEYRNLGNRRRILRIALPLTPQDNNFLGMENNYLVYHSPNDFKLRVVDFWPSW